LATDCTACHTLRHNSRGNDLTNTIEKRFEQIEKNQLLHREAIENRIDQSEKNMNMRFEQFEKNITARFEDLKQEVRAQRK